MASENNSKIALKIIDKVYLGLLLVIFGGIVLHAPLTVALSSIFPDYSLLIKSWKEILMLGAFGIALYLMYKNKVFSILKQPIMLAILFFAGLHLILLFFQFQGIEVAAAGLLIDLRYLLFFCLVYLATQLYSGCRSWFLKVGVVGAVIVLVFALLQVFVLPDDILKYLGYGANTISPYLTIDRNPDFVRINSTLRGPNPLGAYTVIVLALLLVAKLKNKIPKTKKAIILSLIFAIGGIVALWASYSRSAWLGAIIAILIILAVTVFKKFSKKVWIILSVLIVASVSCLAIFSGSSLVSNLLLHENPGESNNINSNEGHVVSLQDSFSQMLVQPFGAGIGSTGSPSLLGDNPEIIECQYLLTSHEVGWLGLALFLYIFGLILTTLWQKRQDWLALGVFASGVSLFVVGIFLPVWTDDTVAIIWWGLAALALGGIKGHNK